MGAVQIRRLKAPNPPRGVGGGRCPVCLHSFQDAKRATLRRADLRQRSKDTCTYCQTRYGFDYYVQPAAHRNPTRREAKAYAATAED